MTLAPMLRDKHDAQPRMSWLALILAYVPQPASAPIE